MINTTEVGLYGIGKGGAQVWGQNKALSMLQSAYQQDQLRRQKEDAEIADQMGKINYDAARNEDLPQILDKYNGIKNTFTQIRGTTNQMDRIKLQAKMDQQKADLTRSVNLSKQAAQQIHDLGQLRLTHPDDISDEFTTQFKTLNGTSTFDPKFSDHANNLSTSALAPKFDVQAYNKRLTDRSVDNYQSPERHIKDGRINATVRDEGKRLSADNILHNLITDYSTDRKLQRYINSTYKDLPVEEAIKKYAADIYVGNKDAYDTVKQVNVRSVNDPEPDKFYEHYNYSLAHPKANSFFMGSPQGMNIPYAGGKANVQMDDYVPISVAKKNFAGSPYIDMKTGKEGGKLSSSSDYEIVGVSNAPFIKSGDLKGAISQPGYEKRRPDNIEKRPVIHVQMKDPISNITKDYLVPYDRLPENVKNTKQIQAALKNFKPAGSNEPVKSNQKVSKKKDPLGLGL